MSSNLSQAEWIWNLSQSTFTRMTESGGKTTMKTLLGENAKKFAADRCHFSGHNYR